MCKCETGERTVTYMCGAEMCISFKLLCLLCLLIQGNFWGLRFGHQPLKIKQSRARIETLSV